MQFIAKNKGERLLLTIIINSYPGGKMKKTALFFLACILLVSCGGKKEVKQVSQESRTATEAFALAETLRSSFIKKDPAIMQRNSSDDGFRDITANRKAYDSVDITFTPRWVEIEGTKLFLNIAWKSTWTLSGQKTEERGMAVFVMEGSPLRMTKILRANPFVYPGQ
jgi:uncharacterized protein YcfL